MLIHRCSRPECRAAGTKTSFRAFALVLAILLLGIHTFGEIFHCRLHGGWAVAVDQPLFGSQSAAFIAPATTPLAGHEDCGLCVLNGLAGVLCGTAAALAVSLIACIVNRGALPVRVVTRPLFRSGSRAPPVFV